jgi:hypothetical protein
VKMIELSGNDPECGADIGLRINGTAMVLRG